MKLSSLSLKLIPVLVAFDPTLVMANDFQSKAQAAFAPIVQEFNVPGLIVGITRDGVHEFYATGLAQREQQSPVTPDTLFELGSISKIFTATLAAWAEHRGDLNLNETMAHHLCDDKCTIGDKLTLMDLATHHSGGLPLQVPEKVSDIAGLVNWLKEWRPSDPGARSYSNISIGMLGYISGKALASDYREAVQTMLFPALGLRNSWIDIPSDKMDSYAFGYDRKTDAPIRVTPGVLDAEAYGVKSSARDMLRLLDIEMGAVTVSHKLQEAIHRTQQGQYKTALFTQDMIWEQYPWPVAVEQMVQGNGYDFILKPQAVEKIEPPLPPQKHVILNKTGSTNGFGGYVAMIPSERLGVVVLANKNYPNEARVTATYALIKSLLQN
ncbi:MULTISPECIES: class C beta-lactamase [Ochrobactrum]|uniref:Beta-lactamase n=1 Tax=Ochrobactrum quorumnocens TaxID=271865 RepID=A0A5N1JFP2_9HYPH|nr:MULTISPECIES: class C beta-lactamase [Brucella/Ochrobactrum group]KAA9354291.1 beta-lactamase [[Ochrobactrum] quorumnocens]MDH7792421.1 beta-lactamase class C [Ochrobactrum sp. AN78]